MLTSGNIVVEASRTILFSIHSRMGLNLEVLFVWCAVSVALFPVACWLKRWKTEAKKKEKEGGEE